MPKSRTWELPICYGEDMSCHTLEPLITITAATRGRGYDVTRHRRDCGMAMRSMSAPDAGGMTVNQTEFFNRAVTGHQGPFEVVPRDHTCMKRRYRHVEKEEGGLL